MGISGETRLSHVSYVPILPSLRTLQLLLRNTIELTMASLRSLRPLAAQTMRMPLPRIVRSYSSAATASYENLLVSAPKPGVALSTEAP